MQIKDFCAQIQSADRGIFAALSELNEQEARSLTENLMDWQIWQKAGTTQA